MVRSFWWAPLVLAQCGPVRHLGYDTSAIAAEPGPTINAAVNVELFEDKRRAHEPELVFSAATNPVTLAGKKVCLNLERDYAGTIRSDVRSVVEKHLRQRGVISAESTGAEAYVLDGSIVKLFGKQDFPKMAGFAGPSFVGLAAENAINESPGQIEIVFNELRLTRLRDQATRQLPEVRVNFEGGLSGVRAITVDGDGDCGMVFGHVDDHLKQAVEALAIAVERELRAWSEQ